jgi:hypothetical protein
MAQKIVIAELDIDINALLKSTSELKKQIDALKNTQKDLAASGQSTSEAFIQNEAVLKSLNTAYASNVKALTESGKATATQADKSELLSLALSQEATSIAEAREQNKLLNKLRNETNVTTAEGQAQLTALNAKLDENNNFIKENADQYLKQKINIGNYSDSIKEALSNLNPLNGGLSGFIERSKQSGGAGNLLKDSLSGAAQGFGGLVKSSLAFIATPIGAVIAALVVVFSLIKNAMNRSEESTNKITKVFTIFSGIVNKLLKALEPLGEFIINYIVGYLELMGAAAEKAAKLVSSALSLLGFDEAAKSIDGFVESTKAGIEASKRLADAEAELAKQQRLASKIQLDYQKDAEKLRQIRDDESKSISERIKANQDLGLVLKKQLDEELKIAKLALEVANLRINAEGKTAATLDAQAEALTKISDIQERITGQESEQLVNENSLRKEAADKQKELADQARERRQKALDDIAQKAKAELDLFLSTQNMKNKSIQEQLKISEQAYQKQLEINQKEFNASEKTEVDKLNLQTKNNDAKNSFLQQQSDTLLQFANAELDLFLATEKSKLEGAQFLTEQLISEEERRLKEIEKRKIENLAKEKEIDLQQLEAKKLNNEALTKAEIEFETQRIILAGETDSTIQNNKQLLEDQIKQQKAEQLAAQKEIDLANAQTKFEEDMIRAQQEYDAELEQLRLNLEAKKITEDQYNEKKRQADVKKDQMERLAMLNKTSAQLQEMQKVGAGLEGLFGKNKAISSATALINGGLAVTEILKTPSVLPEPAASISRGIQIAGTVATTARSIAQINGAKFEKGGIQEIGGKRHSAGGTKFWGEDGTMFEAEAGEGIGILNRNAFASFMDFNNSHLGGRSTGGFFQGGGIITQGVRPETINIEGVVDAIASMPPPVVAVEEIQTVGNRYTNVVSGANL